MPSPRKKNKVIHSQGRELVTSIIRKCDEEAQNNALKYTLNQATKRAAWYADVSETTVKKIRKEDKVRQETNPDALLTTPGKKRNSRPLSTIVNVDDFDKCVIRRTIHEFYLQQKKVPTLLKLLPLIRNKINFPWCKSSLHTVIKGMGFKWKKCQSQRKVLLERADVVSWRHQYLLKIRQFREGGRELVYLYESWVDTNLTFHKCWQDDCGVAVTMDVNAEKRLIIVHACGINGFLKNAELLYKAGSATGDYHGQMNYINFEKWIQEKLIPSLPPQAVVIMDNAPYHCMQIDKVPSRYAIKQDMLCWLRKKEISCTEKMRKEELHCLIDANKPTTKCFRVDTFLAEHGHTVLRLPPYMCDLNPIELAWAKVKQIVREHNVTGDLSMQALTDFTKQGILSVTKEDWGGYFTHVKRIEEKYWETDDKIPDVIDKIIISIGSMDSDSSVSPSDNDDDMDSDSNDYKSSASSTSSYLATPL